MTKEYPKTLYLHQPNWYNIDTTKLKTVTDVVGLLTALDMKVSENYEKFDEVKHLLIIPEKPKSLEEIQREYDERIKSIKLKFEVLQNRLERNYDLTFDRIIRNFEYAQNNGFFPISLTTSGTIGLSGSYLVNTGSNSVALVEIRPNANPVGYWSVKPNMRIWLDKTPNPIVRFFSKLLLDFTWVSK